jgi:hypothetical protein
LNYIGLVLNSESGVVAVDGKDIRAGRPEEEIFRFNGALDTLGHIMNVYLRRFYKSDSAISKLLFKAVTESHILKKLNEQESFERPEVYKQIPDFITSLPIPSIASKDQKISEE